MPEHDQLWEKCLGEIEIELSKPNFSTWFKNTSLVKEEEGVYFVGVPNEFVKDWLFKKYHKLIIKTLRNYSENIRSIEYIITKIESRAQSSEQERVQTSQTEQKNELPLHDLYINKEDNLNPKYVFDSFIVGSFNELAHAAAQAIVTRPGQAYNPFFVYGGTGLGKTHLIQSIGNAIKKRFPEKKVNYLSLEKFSIDYITSLQNNKPNNFKEKYRKYDVIIMDDIQFASNKEKTQEELFHLFNTLYENNKQIVFSSDKHPNFIPGLEERLKSRFSAGMIVDIVEPEYESRLAILKTKAINSGFDIEPAILEYISASIEGNVRELEGSLNSIICQIQLKKRSLSLNEVRALIKNNVKPKKNVSVKDVVKIVSDFYTIGEESIYEKTRRKEIVKARQIIMYLLREEFNVSFPMIGQKLGGKDHTTVIHSCLKIKKDMKTDSLLCQEIEQIKTMFK